LIKSLGKAQQPTDVRWSTQDTTKDMLEMFSYRAHTKTVGDVHTSHVVRKQVFSFPTIPHRRFLNELSLSNFNWPPLMKLEH